MNAKAAKATRSFLRSKGINVREATYGFTPSSL